MSNALNRDTLKKQNPFVAQFISLMEPDMISRLPEARERWN
ncbi:MAG: hypothetical protein WA672_03020 [Candidatus Angelobacter sp.]